MRNGSSLRARLSAAVRAIRASIREGAPEWVADNYYLIDRQYNAVRKSDGLRSSPQTESVAADYLASVGWKLTEESQSVLREIIPMYLGVLLQDNYLPYIAEIIIEGHTDTDGTYDSNMTLSFNRADSVAKFCMNPGNGLAQEQIDRFQRLLTVNGRSYSDPIYEAPDRVDMASSRRVEIKFRLKEDEMIERIAEILRGQEVPEE